MTDKTATDVDQELESVGEDMFETLHSELGRVNLLVEPMNGKFAKAIKKGVAASLTEMIED